MAKEAIDQNAYFGVRVTAAGDFTPELSVGIVVHLINVPPGTTPPPGPSQQVGASVTQSTDQTDWIVTVTAVPSGFANETMDLDLASETGVPVVAPTPLGSLFVSPYGNDIVYVPAVPGSGMVNAGDRVLISMSAYPIGSAIGLRSDDLLLFFMILA